MFDLEFNGSPYIKVDNQSPLFFIAGPCAIESRSHALEVSAALKEIFSAAGIPFIYKSSFDKANRSSGAGFRGVGMKEGLSILAEVRESRNIPVLTDIHTAEQLLLWRRWWIICKHPLSSAARRTSSWPPQPP